MVKKNTMLRNISIIVVTLLLMGLIVFLVGRSFGFFQYAKKGDTVNVITINGLDVNITNNSENALNLQDAYPMYDADGMQESPLTFTIENTSSRAIDYTLKVENDTEKQAACKLENNDPCPQLSTSNIKYAYKIGNGEYSQPQNLGTSSNIILTNTILRGQTQEISLILWIDSNAGNEIQGQYFFGQLLIQGSEGVVTCDTSGDSINDVEMWLSCGNVGANYTTLQEVLADTEALQNLINSTQANDYLVLSTDWASAITSNETAMTYIGNNDYSANKLLSNSTWLAEIANSTYFEKVLNVKVPTMISNTEPSGVVSASSVYSGSYAEYMAFDNNEDTRWSTLTTNAASGYLRYKFDSPVCIKKIYVNNGATQAISFKIQASNDEINWVDITDTYNKSYGVGGVQVSFILDDNDQSYMYYQYSFIDNTGPTGDTLWELQFYGRSAS